MGNQGCHSILLSLQNNLSLHYLNLEGNNCDNSILIEIQRLLDLNRQGIRTDTININREFTNLTPALYQMPIVNHFSLNNLDQEFVEKYNNLLIEFKKLEDAHLFLNKKYEEERINNELSKNGFIQTLNAEKQSKLHFETEIKRLNEGVINQERAMTLRLEDQKNFYNNELIARDNSNQLLKGDVDKLKIILNEKEAIIERLKEDLLRQENCRILEQKILELEGQLNACRSENESNNLNKQATIEQLNNENIALKDELNVITMNLESKLKEQQEVILALENKCNNYNNNIEWLNNANKESNEKISRLSQENYQIEYMVNENNRLKEELNKSKINYDHLLGDCKLWKEKCDDLTLKNSEIEKEIYVLKSDINELVLLASKEKKDLMDKVRIVEDNFIIEKDKRIRLENELKILNEHNRELIELQESSRKQMIISQNPSEVLDYEVRPVTKYIKRTIVVPKTSLVLE